MSKYAEFFEEVAGWKTIETDEFFMTYQVSEIQGIKSLKVVNAFVAKPFRCKGKSHQILALAEEEARKQGCAFLTAVVAKDSSEFVQQRTAHILRTNGMQFMYEDDYNAVYGRRL